MPAVVLEEDSLSLFHQSAEPRANISWQAPHSAFTQGCQRPMENCLLENYTLKSYLVQLFLLNNVSPHFGKGWPVLASTGNKPCGLVQQPQRGALGSPFKKDEEHSWLTASGCTAIWSHSSIYAKTSFSSGNSRPMLEDNRAAESGHFCSVRTS